MAPYRKIIILYNASNPALEISRYDPFTYVRNVYYQLLNRMKDKKNRNVIYYVILSCVLTVKYKFYHFENVTLLAEQSSWPYLLRMLITWTGWPFYNQ